ncbi:thioredoxin family protein [Kitasatospora sp. NPDC127116]|uniref:thioredoxin family protein n=1 Tax=Kitasatospora sp. NPDC127116 TaxID=3345367 RepID=UPI003630B36C
MMLFTSPTCQPCKRIKPLVLEAFPNTEVVDITAASSLKKMNQHDVYAVPTLITDSGVGYIGEAIVSNFLKENAR